MSEQTVVVPKTMEIVVPNGDSYSLTETESRKEVRGPGYNYNFDKKTGYFERWGDKIEDDPMFAPCGPELLDLEISVNGCPNGCRFCYKNNSNAPPTNMSFETFQQIFHKMGPQICQIAFGITGVQTNPDFLKMMKYSREHGVIPNFTLSGKDLTDEIASEIAQTVGALAVSIYEHDKETGYNTVKKFADLGIEQTNVHLMVSRESLVHVLSVLADWKRGEPRLRGVNAFIFLGVKPKGRAKDNFHPLSQKEYGLLMLLCMKNGIPFGFDSCSAPKYERIIRSAKMSDETMQKMLECAESCESGLMSSYINTDAKFFPCSFTEGTEGIEPVNVLEHDSFLDVWYHKETEKWRKTILDTVVDGCRHCPAYPEINE